MITLNRYLLFVPGRDGGVIAAAHLRMFGLEAPVVVLHEDTLCLYTPIRWVRLRGLAH